MIICIIIIIVVVVFVIVVVVIFAEVVKRGQELMNYIKGLTHTQSTMKVKPKHNASKQSVYIHAYPSKI